MKNEKIDWLYNYSEDPRIFINGKLQVTKLLDEIKDLTLFEKFQVLKERGYPEKEPSVAWIEKQIIDNASITEIVIHMRHLAEVMRFED